jgi:hypothetical protein
MAVATDCFAPGGSGSELPHPMMRAIAAMTVVAAHENRRRGEMIRNMDAIVAL